MKVDESVIAHEMGTDQDGTDNVGLLADALNRRLPNAKYRAIYLTRDPVSADEKTLLWWNLVRSIDNGYGVATNWVSPPSNKPRGVKGSPTPRYGGGTTFHYVAAMGWSDEGNNGRPAVFIVDSGFWPGAYWVDFEQYASLITPKGYAFADLPLIAAPTPPPPVVVPPELSGRLIVDPKTKSLLTQRPNAYVPRGGDTPMWIACHTSESRSRAVNLRNFCESNSVSYHRLVDDVDIVEMVRDSDAPWAAVGANKFAYHICWSSSFASWSRSQWLDPNPSDGYNEREALRKGARQIAFWIQQSHAHGRPIPAVWIGGKQVPPWGLSGICGHKDFGPWGGGHSDPGPNFPVDQLLADINSFLTGVEQPPLVPLPPVIVSGTDPTQYAGWLLYQGNPSNNVDRVKAVQSALKRRFSYGAHLVVDGNFGPLTKAAVVQFQRNAGLVSDGIVGPATAVALQP